MQYFYLQTCSKGMVDCVPPSRPGVLSWSLRLAVEAEKSRDSVGWEKSYVHWSHQKLAIFETGYSCFLA